MKNLYIFVVFFVVTVSRAFAGTPTVDPAGSTTATATGTNTLVVNITTSSTNDLIIVDIYAESTNIPSPTVTAVSGGGLVWSNRYSYQQDNATCGTFFNTTCHDDFERWTAPSTGTLTAQPITITFSRNVDAAIAGIYGINGLNDINIPYDPSFTSGALHLSDNRNFFSFGTIPIFTGISTTNPNDFVIATAASPFLLNGYAFVRCSAPTFQNLVGGTYRPGTPYVRFLTTYLGVASAQSGVGYSMFFQGGTGVSCAAPTGINSISPLHFSVDVLTGNATGGTHVLFQTPW